MKQICRGQCLRGTCPFDKCIRTGKDTSGDGGHLNPVDEVVLHATSEGTCDVGIAVDAGSTMLEARLYDLESSKLLASARELNPQLALGRDVITRIEYVTNVSEGLPEMRSLIRSGIQALISSLLDESSLEPNTVRRMVIAGNTTIMHLLMGLSPSAMGAYPYTPESLFGMSVPSSDLEIDVQCSVYLPPCVSAFIGADTVCGLLALQAAGSSERFGLIDLGTNAEMAISEGTSIVCASAAAGPVFEGGGISCGMPALPGAIEHVQWKDGAFEVRTVAGEQPQGLSSSGLIDAVAVCLAQGFVDQTGAIEEGPPLVIIDGEKSIRIAGDIVLTQGDLRRFQTAKAAVSAGFEVLRERAGSCDVLYLSGGLAKSVSLSSAHQVGLLPDDMRTVAVGNTCMEGASRVLLDPGEETRAAELASASSQCELAANPEFTSKYVENMLLGEET